MFTGGRFLWGMVLLLAACAEPREFERIPTAVTVAEVQSRSGAETTRYSGTVGPRSTTRVAFRVPGYIDKLRMVPTTSSSSRSRPIQEGDSVRQGDVLASLRQAEYAVQVDKAQAQLEQARAGLAKARAGLHKAEVARAKAGLDLERAKALFESKSIPKPKMEAAQAQFDAAEADIQVLNAEIELVEAQIKGAQAFLAEAQLAVQDCTLRAPSSGIVIQRSIEIGQLVAPGSPAFTIADPSVMKVTFAAPDVLLTSLRQGQSFALTSHALPGVEFEGLVTKISPAADLRSRAFDVEISVPNQDGALQIGMIASISIEEGSAASPVATVPLTAVIRSPRNPERFAVFVVQKEGGRDVAKAREIKLGGAFGNQVAVLEGASVGEVVVTAGASLIQDGEQVRIIP